MPNLGEFHVTVHPDIAASALLSIRDAADWQRIELATREEIKVLLCSIHAAAKNALAAMEVEPVHDQGTDQGTAGGPQQP